MHNDIDNMCKEFEFTEIEICQKISEEMQKGDHENDDRKFIENHLQMQK